MSLKAKVLLGIALSSVVSGIACITGAVVFVASSPALITIGVGTFIGVGAVYGIACIVSALDNSNVQEENKTANIEAILNQNGPGNELRNGPGNGPGNELGNGPGNELGNGPGNGPGNELGNIYELLKQQAIRLSVLEGKQETDSARMDNHERKVEIEQELQNNDILELKGRLIPPGYSQLADKHGVFAKSQNPLNSAANDDTSEPGPASGPRVRGVRRD